MLHMVARAPRGERWPYEITMIARRERQRY